ncbi:TetR/AcrR family transcriptional regulator [Reinekea sp.]|jgi:AcrR family transcriptional regulator|uniref:TetR/AcrR family transcriptional regulator n=1 Tax=Reinekea sp. TaxID=1970455 RepID=UPI003988E267
MDSAQTPSDSTRAALLESARELFLKNAYSNISIRRIADRAKVNSAMIAYYFGSKSGLFREMMASYVAQVTSELKANIGVIPKESSLEDILLNFYRSMPAELAMLVFRTLIFEQSEMREWMLETLIRPTLALAEEYFGNVIVNSSREEITMVVRVSFQSLLLGPKLLEKPMNDLDPGVFNEAFYRDLAHFNAKLFATYFNLEK